MTTYELTPEEQVAWSAINKRAALFIERMERVSDPNFNFKNFTCESCGYPHLYYDIDERDWCVICRWDSYDEISEDGPWCIHVASDENLNPLTLARARSNFIRSGSCLDADGAIDYGKDFPEQRATLVAALDALISDNDAAKDKERWGEIRRAYNVLADLLKLNPGWRWSSRWRFAAKIDSNSH